MPRSAGPTPVRDAALTAAAASGCNIEIKARIADLDALEQRVARIATSGPIRIVQTDTFYPVPNGRLKLRVFEDGTGELIHYERPDTAEAVPSEYTIHRTDEPTLLGDALAGALGCRGIVRKTRTLYLQGQTRIHLDRVEGLGSFAELEVVLAPGQEADAGRAIAERLLTELGISPGDLVRPAYIDLLEGRDP